MAIVGIVVVIVPDVAEARIAVNDEGIIDRDVDPFAGVRRVGHGIGLKLARSLAETERCTLHPVEPAARDVRTSPTKY